ncbi:MAG: PilX N-terminal domain-containing pilus assembly protein [Steroidobacteraceae bacterium]
MITPRQHSVPRPQRSVPRQRSMPQQRGVVLITALLLLIVVTLLAVSMFRSFGLDEKIAGNVREKQRALNAAETAEQYAEYWLATGNGAAAVTCSGVVNFTVGQVCSNPLLSYTSLPWQYNGSQVGVTYAPTAPTAMNITTTPDQGSYYYTPAFYITYLGQTANGNGKIYQIDAAGFGGSPDTAAVVESTYLVQSNVTCLGCSQ